MNEDCPRKKVVIEDLLRLKRAERPPPEFWTRFERELRAKQLAAIVEKPTWWRAWSQNVQSLSQMRLPLGAAAILAITFLTVHEYRVPKPDLTSTTLNETVLPSLIGGPAVEAQATIPHQPSTAALELPDSASSNEQLVAAKIAPGFSPVLEEATESISPSVATTSAEFSPGVPDVSTDASLIASLSGNSGFEARALPARSPLTEPLAQVATPKSVRLRDRYLGGAFPAGYSIDATASPERSVTRLRDRQLRPEDFSRFDARGNSLSIKL